MGDTSERHFRELKDLSLIDDFLFGLFIQEAGKDIVRRLLEVLLGITIAEIELVHKQHAVKNDPKKHGVYLDAYIKDTNGVLYNIEVQVYYIKSVAKRMRYHQSLIDRELMPSGEYEYDKLSRTIIIFIVDHDVFKKGLYRYTFKNMCIEDNAVDFDDDTLKVVLNTKGKQKDGVSAELVEILEYFHNSDSTKAQNSEYDLIKQIDRIVTRIKNSPEFGGEFMSYQEALYHSERKGEEKGEKKGFAAGKAAGKLEGVVEGAVKTYFECGKTPEEIIASIINKFDLTHEKAEEYVREFAP